MSTGQLGLLKKLADGQGFSTELSANSEPEQIVNSKERNIETSPCRSSLEEKEEEREEEKKGYGDEDDDDGDDYSDEEKDDDDDDERSYESETLDNDDDDDELSSSSSSSSSSESQSLSQVSLKSITKNEVASASLALVKDEDQRVDEIQDDQNPESNNKAAKSVSFDGTCKSKDVTHTESSNSSSSSSSSATIPDLLAVPKDGRQKVRRQENINLGADEENVASLSVSKTSSNASVSPTGSTHTSNEHSLRNAERNSLTRIPCQELTSILDNSSSSCSSSSTKLSPIKDRRQRQERWVTPVSIDERLDWNYKELYQLMTRDVEVKGNARQYIHAYQMEQLYDKYISVSKDKIPPITLYPHNWPQCVIRRLFCPALSTLHSSLTDPSNATSFMKPTYMIPRSTLSVKNDPSMKKTRKAKESKAARSSSKLNNQMSVQDNSQKSRPLSNDQPTSLSSSSAHFVDHRLGQSTNPDILKWLSGKNQIFWKQKREEKVQKKLEKETKRLEILRKAERRLQSQQAVYNWMQEKLKEKRLSSLEEKISTENKSEIKKTFDDTFVCHDTFSGVKIQQDKDDSLQSCSSKLLDSQSKLKSHLKPLQSQAKTDKEGNVFTVKNAHFKHMESNLSYDAWTRQTANEVGTKDADFKGSIKSAKKIVKDRDSECLGKEKENISLQENEERQCMRKPMVRPKTARRTRTSIKHSYTSNFLDVSDSHKASSHSEEKEEERKEEERKEEGEERKKKEEEEEKEEDKKEE